MRGTDRWRASNRIHPLAVVLDELDQPLCGPTVGDVALDAFLADVEADLAGTGAHVAEVGVCHFAINFQVFLGVHDPSFDPSIR